ncbi:stage II sporulation protein D [Anaerobranca californiensis DSM 14826]|jgi:stage II sporulation protein D|uniref:Stage II sporulation protein D n=1 Tax=Anaerobranca californiensis DSM 14826 TaxID=1120989 RepID=A0A1M6MBW3_9FIRM|nr:stage II sporulation protein D [Anaerobranca californiensis]SHJ80850.1 stage II sporulation protein D [Anaerobranca californiensis DSM 14826]
MGKNILIYFGVTLIILLILPAVLVKSCKGPIFPDNRLDPSYENIKINVYFHKENKLKEMDLEEYIIGVVAGEMPARFDIEALKAQAVIARTYAVTRMQLFGGRGYSGYPGADICDDYRHSQHYLTPAEAKSNWPFWQRSIYWRKIVEGVYSTKGEIISYQGKPIDALYHSTCGGATENSEEVFTNYIPYLRGVNCPYCKDSPRFTQKVTYTKTGFKNILEGEGLQRVVGAKEIDMGIVSKTNSDRITYFRIGDKIYRGSDVRLLFKLNSARFTYNYDGTNIVFNVVGYGHGVGMCQYGANGLAKKGYNYKDIIKYYYTDVELENLHNYLSIKE